MAQMMDEERGAAADAGVGGGSVGLFGPVFLWLLIQMGALGVVAARVPFSAPKRFPQPAEVLALRVMLSVQIAAAALCFPLLMRTVTSGVITTAAAVPFVVVAGLLAGEWNPWRHGFTAAYVVAWMIGLSLWRVALRSARAQAAGMAIAVLVAVGGPLFWYLRGEFQLQSDAVAWENVGNWGPIFGAMMVSGVKETARGPWVFMGFHVILGAIAAVMGRIACKTR